MKIFGSLLILAAAVAAAATAGEEDDEDKALEDFLTASLLQLKKEIPAGIPDLDIPPTDPFSLPDLSRDWTTPLAQMSFVMKDVASTGLSKFDPRTVSIVGDRVDMELALPTIGFSGDYVMKGSILGMIPVAGKGDADIAVMDISASVSAKLAIDDDNVTRLVDLETRLRRGPIAVAMLQRFPGIDDLVKEALRMIADKVFEHYRGDVEAALSDALTKGLNAALRMRSDVDVSALALPAPERRVYEAGNANEFIDHLISQARPAIAAKDPLTLPEARKGFEKTILGARIHGEAKIYDGFLNGIQTIHRTGDCEMQQSADMTTLKIKAHLGLANLHGHYRMHAKFMNIGPSAEVSVKVSLISVEGHVSVDLSSGKPTAVLEYFDISYIGKIELMFDGLGPLDWIINPLGGWIINLVKHKIADAVEGPLRKLIAQKMQDIEFPMGY